jgi:hypothetical protein
METDQVLRVSVKPQNEYGSGEAFYARMHKSGRITIPKLVMKLLRQEKGDQAVAAGMIMKVQLEPT